MLPLRREVRTRYEDLESEAPVAIWKLTLILVGMSLGVWITTF